ncbi:MAG: hypothetical protein GY768_04510 [Planctomycetaceae bacterium]|nr:hypothetical protein [Planctomycetaceae bacterium]
MSSTLIALFVIIAALGMLLGYQLGFSAGKRSGFDKGHRDGKKEGSVKAYAVGYDRGRHDREVKKKEEEGEERSRPGLARLGCSVFFCLLLLSVVALVVRIIGNKMELLANFPSR